MDGDFPLIAALYFILVIVIGTYYLMNLILAVIIHAFIEISKQNEKEGFLHLVKSETKTKIEDQRAQKSPIEAKKALDVHDVDHILSIQGS